MAGFEPALTRLQTEDVNQATPHPVGTASTAGGTRTHKGFRPMVFETISFTNFDTAARSITVARRCALCHGDRPGECPR